MVKLTHQEHQLNGDLVAGEKVALYVNDAKVIEYIVATGNTGKATFMYQESAPA